jgi:microcystin-dependent protein
LSESSFSRITRKWWFGVIVGVLVGLAIGLPLGGKTLFREAEVDSMSAGDVTVISGASLTPPANSVTAGVTVYAGQSFQINLDNSYYVQYYDPDYLTYNAMYLYSGYGEGNWVHAFTANTLTGAQPTVVRLGFPIINNNGYDMSATYSVNIVPKGDLAVYRAFPNSHATVTDDEHALSEVKLFAYDWDIVQFTPCKGAQLAVADNQALFKLIGNTFGGDGSTTFAVPSISGFAAPLDELTYQMCTSGAQPAADAGPAGKSLQYCPGSTWGYDGYFIGEVVLAKNVWDQVDWMVPCDGRLLNINTNTALFALLGSQYGGDGMYSFGVPDMRGVSSPMDGASYYIVTEGTFPERS